MRTGGTPVLQVPGLRLDFGTDTRILSAQLRVPLSLAGVRPFPKLNPIYLTTEEVSIHEKNHRVAFGDMCASRGTGHRGCAGDNSATQGAFNPKRIYQAGQSRGAA